MRLVFNILFAVFFSFNITSCTAQSNATANNQDIATKEELLPFNSTIKAIHIFVALCDNKYQGIVPVPAKIGNGQDPNNNLYWGCGYGIRTFFKNSIDWKLKTVQKSEGIVLERLIFKHSSKNIYLIADAYDGQFIKQCTKDFVKSSAGQMKDVIVTNSDTIGVAGNANLVAYTKMK